MSSIDDALHYHSHPKPGKIAVHATKTLVTQRDLSLAYSPGVAEPCRAIALNDEDVFKYTSKGNLVAVISDGTAVLSWTRDGMNAGTIRLADEASATGCGCASTQAPTGVLWLLGLAGVFARRRRS